MVNVVGPQTPEIVGQQPDPNWLSQMAQGRSAASRIAEALRGPQMQQAMQMMNARMAPVQQQGWATRDPSMLEGIAQFAQNMRGQSLMKSLQSQAQDLRAQEEQGAQAELARQDFIRQQNQDFQRQMAEDSRTAMRGSAETWVDDDGNRVNLYNTQRGPVDSRGNPVDLTNLRRAEDIESQSIGALLKQVPSADRRKALEHYDELSSLSDISAVARRLSTDDKRKLNQAGFDVAIKAATPAAFENYVNTNLKGYSKEVKDYLEKVHAYSAIRRKNLSGTALTQMENTLSQMFLPSASGLNFEDTLRRVDSEAQRNTNALQNVDRLYGTNIMGRAPIYKPLSAAEIGEGPSRAPLAGAVQAAETASQQVGQQPMQAPNLQALGQQLQQMSARMAELQAKARGQ